MTLESASAAIAGMALAVAFAVAVTPAAAAANAAPPAPAAAPPAAAPAPRAPTIPAPPMGNGVTRAAGYEAAPTQYIVANPTNIFSNHFVYGTTVVGEIPRGQRVEALAKVQGYEWLLVGRNGQGIGYVPISMLSPAHLYIP